MNPTQGAVAMTTETTDRNRWAALYVLCAGALMIVLDATIVNVALPVDPGRPRLLAEQPGVGRQRLPDRVRRPAAARRPRRRPDRPAPDLPDRPDDLHRRVAAVRASSQTQEMLIAARFIQGAGGALTSAVVLGMIVTMFPEPREQAKALGVYGFVASAGGSIGLLRRRRADRRDQLALDLLHQPADRRAPPACSRCGWSSAPGHRPGRRRRPARRGAADRAA